MGMRFVTSTSPPPGSSTRFAKASHALSTMSSDVSMETRRPDSSRYVTERPSIVRVKRT